MKTATSSVLGSAEASPGDDIYTALLPDLRVSTRATSTNMLGEQIGCDVVCLVMREHEEWVQKASYRSEWGLFTWFAWMLVYEHAQAQKVIRPKMTQ